MTQPPRIGANKFRKARASEPQANCVHVAREGGWVNVRDSKIANPDSTVDPRLYFTSEQFNACLQGIRAGKYDR